MVFKQRKPVVCKGVDKVTILRQEMAVKGKNNQLNLIWEKSLKYLQGLLNEETYKNWIIPIVPIAIDDEEVTLGVSDAFFISWLKDNFGDLIINAVSSSVQRPMKIKYEPGHIVKPEIIKEDKKTESTNKASEKASSGKAKVTKNCHIRHTFKNFVIGPENEFAAAAAMGITKSSTSNSTNPLFIYGSTGLGKTHLLQAVAHKVSERKPDAIVEYISCEDFLNLFIDSLKSNRHAKFRNRFRKADFLLIDDIHFLAGKTQLQEEFFNTFNKLYNEDKKILLTSDRRPSEIDKLEDRLVSRFDSGLTVDIQPLGVETRLAVLRKKQEEHLTKIDDDVLLFIASRITSNVRRLEGALTRLLTYHSLKGGEISVHDAAMVLKPMLEEEVAASVTIETIQRKVANHFDLKVADLTGSKRPRNIAIPRMLAMYFCRKMTDKSLPEIGSSFARNHATVLHAVKEVQKRQERDESFKHTVSFIERQLQNSQG